MNKKFLVAGLAVLVLLLAACQVTIQQPGEQLRNTITVSGSAQFKLAPDEATIMLRVETNGTTPKEAQDKNSFAMSAVQNALKKAGVAKDDMETTNYNLYPNTYWDDKIQRMVTVGYKASHTLKVRTKDLAGVGGFVQAGVDAGATSVDGISFGLSKPAEKDAKNEALRQAVQEARQKAEALADGLDVRLGKVVSVHIVEYGIIPMYRSYAELATAEKAPAPPIAPGDVDVSANVQVVFEIG